MVKFERKTLHNGLKVILHHDPGNPLASVDLHYIVGSRDDEAEKTGIAHLFEHLMFSGTRRVPNFDQVVQNAGGENNAFTTSDSTNYHITLPVVNLDTALMLEADRMKNLRLNKEIIEREKQVVLEEYKETSLNKPYGESYHLLSKLAYLRHPYQWPTIGKDEKSIQGISRSDVKRFYKQYYQPSNAILSITSQLESDVLMPKVEHYFKNLRSIPFKRPKYAKEYGQRKQRTLVASQKTPADAIYMAFHMEGRLHKDFYVADIISDILSNGHSTRLFKKLVRGRKLVSTIDAYITASLDPGLFIVEAKAIPGKSIQQVESAIWDELKLLKTQRVRPRELVKMKNTIESSLVFSEVNGLNKAITLGFFEMLGDAARSNQEGEIYQSITDDDLYRVANKIFAPQNCSIVYYERSADGAGYYEEDEEDD